MCEVKVSERAAREEFVSVLQRVCEGLEFADGFRDGVVVLEVILDDHAK